jgi:hypothetical protein
LHNGEQDDNGNDPSHEGRLSEENASILARIAEPFVEENAPKKDRTGRARKTGRKSDPKQTDSGQAQEGERKAQE